MGKAIGELFVAISTLIIVSVVVAWGYQVFWNDVVLNIWQLYTTSDVLTAMRVPYGACLAIAFGRQLIFNQKSNDKLPVSEAVGQTMVNLVSRIIMIVSTILIASLVF